MNDRIVIFIKNKNDLIKALDKAERFQSATCIVYEEDRGNFQLLIDGRSSHNFPTRLKRRKKIVKLQNKVKQTQPSLWEANSNG